MALTITQKQFEQLSDSVMTSRLIAALRQKFPAEIDAEEPQQLSEIVTEQLNVARQYGLLSEYSIAIFVVTAWVLGLGFDTRIPAVAECLANEDMNEEDKALWLEQYSVLLLTKLAEG